MSNSRTTTSILLIVITTLDNLTDNHGVPLNESEVAGAIKGNPHDVLIETKLYLKRCSKVTLTILSHFH